jgi:hypothetical protein
MKPIRLIGLLLSLTSGVGAAEAGKPLVVTTPMAAPEWAKLERKLLVDHVAACREFAAKYYDARGYVQCTVRRCF